MVAISVAMYMIDTPLLVVISVAMYMTDDIAEHFEQSSSCNFTKFLGGVPCLERLIGHIYFTKVRAKRWLYFFFIHLRTLEHFFLLPGIFLISGQMVLMLLFCPSICV